MTFQKGHHLLSTYYVHQNSLSSSKLGPCVYCVDNLPGEGRYFAITMKCEGAAEKQNPKGVLGQPGHTAVWEASREGEPGAGAPKKQWAWDGCRDEGWTSHGGAKVQRWEFV